MTHGFYKFGLLVFFLSAFVGCGSKEGTLATDHGTMTLAEFEKLQDEAYAADAAAASDQSAP